VRRQRLVRLNRRSDRAILGWQRCVLKILNSQSTALFELASEKLDSFYRHEHGDKVLSGYTSRAIVCQAVFSGIALGKNCEVSVWSDSSRGLSGRSFLRAMFHVAFNEWHCVRLTAVTRESNAKAQRALAAMGFTFEAPLEAWFGDEPGWMFRMLRHECAWLK
jgi:RimJ/RimL family protein N-acetyltransferase